MWNIPAVGSIMMNVSLDLSVYKYKCVYVWLPVTLTADVTHMKRLFVSQLLRQSIRLLLMKLISSWELRPGDCHPERERECVCVWVCLSVTCLSNLLLWTVSSKADSRGFNNQGIKIQEWSLKTLSDEDERKSDLLSIKTETFDAVWSNISPLRLKIE